jgi:hypothetical protein
VSAEGTLSITTTSGSIAHLSMDTFSTLLIDPVSFSTIKFYGEIQLNNAGELSFTGVTCPDFSNDPVNFGIGKDTQLALNDCNIPPQVRVPSPIIQPHLHMIQLYGCSCTCTRYYGRSRSGTVQGCCTTNYTFFTMVE